MRMQRLLLVSLLGASAVFAAATTAVKLQPLNAATGLWQITQNMTWDSLPPPMAAVLRGMPKTRTYQSCITAQDLSSNPFANGSNDGCTWTVLSSSTTDM